MKNTRVKITSDKHPKAIRTVMVNAGTLLNFKKFIVYSNHNGYNKYCQVSNMK